MKATLSHGLILAAGLIVLTLVGFFLGFQTDKIAEGRWFGLLTFALIIVVTWLGIKAVRGEAKDNSLSYGKGVGSGVLINLYGGVVSSIYSFFHLTFINPSFADYTINATRQQWAEKGLSDAQMDAAEKFMRMILSPIIASISGFIMTVIVGLVVALVASAFLKRAPQPAFETETPAA
jgi:Protein of unknown function (DUF4199)